MIGLAQDKVRVVAYRPEWRALFEAEAERLRAALGEPAGAIEHTGSTAVEGMDAKPIIDLMLAVGSLAEAEALKCLLEGLGYEHMPEDAVPGRVFFRKGPPDNRTHHLSLAEPGGEFWTVQLRFRDHLRSHPEVAEEYRRLKWDLAARFAEDRPAYTAAKGEFVARTLALAGR